METKMILEFLFFPFQRGKMKLWWWACMAFAISVSLAVGSFLLLHSWQGQDLSWVKRQHTYLWERSRPDRPPASTYAYYQHCGSPPEPEQQVMPHAPLAEH